MNYINPKYLLHLKLKNLNLTVTRLNNKREFSVCHKSSHTDTVMNNFAHYLLNHKLAALNSIVNRLVTVSLNNDNFTEGLNIMKQITYNNDYNANLIAKLLRKRRIKNIIQ